MSSKYSVIRKEFFRNHIIQWLFAFAFLLHIILWIGCAWFFHKGGVPVALRFNVYLGIDPTSISPWYSPYRIPVGAFIFLGVQMILSWRFFREKDRIMAHLMVLCGGIVQIAALIALASVVLGNR